MIEKDESNSFNTKTGSLKFGSGSLQIISGQECWLVPNMGIYDSFGKYLGETVEEAAQTLAKREADKEQTEK